MLPKINKSVVKSRITKYEIERRVTYLQESQPIDDNSPLLNNVTVHERHEYTVRENDGKCSQSL